jgi:uncharacterized protein YjbI with pentapeptide repeats
MSELELNSAENYVLEQVEKGKVANLQERFPEEERILKAQFLKRLITEQLPDLRVTKNGIIIYGARIKEKLVLRDAKIPFPVWLVSCIFDKDIDFIKTTFLERADFSGAEFSGEASFSEAKFSGEANFSVAEFSGEASFFNAEFPGEADFSRAKFSGKADFFGAEFSGRTNFHRAKFSEMADFVIAKFSGKAYFWNAKFSERANFSEVYLHKADLRKAVLPKADLSRVDLSQADLSDADLKDCILDSAKLPLIFEPKAGSPPYIPSIAGLPNLSALTFIKSPHGLVDLREGFKKLGYREQEREITYAIRHTQRRKLWNDKGSSLWKKMESLFYYLFFEITCKYGMYPGRPLVLLIPLIIIFTIPYTIVLKSPPGKDGIWKVWIPERARKDLGAKNPYRLNLRFYSALGFGFYFSILSAFSIGWRELNVGNWIARIQRREYTLRATGWVRTVSGIQSLISVYLIALWVLSYFGRPFEAI